MLLREIDEEPSIVVPPDNENWMDEPIECFLKNDKQQDIDDINVIFQFELDLASHGSQISLSMLTHGIAMRLKARTKKQQLRTFSM